jgi:hypothetical protein
LTATATITGIREQDGTQIADMDVSTVDADGVEVVKGAASARLD